LPSVVLINSGKFYTKFSTRTWLSLIRLKYSYPPIFCFFLVNVFGLLWPVRKHSIHFGLSQLMIGHFGFLYNTQYLKSCYLCIFCLIGFYFLQLWFSNLFLILKLTYFTLNPILRFLILVRLVYLLVSCYLNLEYFWSKSVVFLIFSCYRWRRI
jgi:hypothetical protein